MVVIVALRINMAVELIEPAHSRPITWKNVYDSNPAILEEAGVIDDSVHRDLDNPNMVTVYAQFADAAAARAHAARMSSEQFRAMAEKVGIVLPVEVLLMTDVQ